MSFWKINKNLQAFQKNRIFCKRAVWLGGKMAVFTTSGCRDPVHRMDFRWWQIFRSYIGKPGGSEPVNFLGAI